MKNYSLKSAALFLKEWVVFSQHYLYKCEDRQGLISYGVGDHTSWGVQSHQKAFSAFAVAAVCEEIDWSDTPLTREDVLAQALGMLRYTVSSHLTGDYHCVDGEKWGNHWISALGLERMFHAVEAIWDYLTPEDMAGLRKMMLSEADFLMSEYPVRAGLTKENMPESNIWNGSLLYRVAAMYPDVPNRNSYIEKAQRFFVNGISIPSDENSDEICDGVRIGDLFVGANMFETYACNHHGYLNIGYMVICLSNIAMLHFGFKNLNDTNDMIYRHAKELWQLVRSCTYKDGRLLRIGGDTRARYCYCQDYALPVWAFVEDFFGEDCSEFISGWFKILEKEFHANGDGSFLSARMGRFEKHSQLYYTRLESDRANTVSMMVYWYKKYSIEGKKAITSLKSWSDDYHGAAFSVDGNRYASFVWRSAELPQGMLLPKDDSSLAEWRYNLSGRVHGTGLANFDEYERSQVKLFDGGFVTSGSTCSVSDNHLAEGQPKEYIARKKIAFAALPDERTVLCLQNAVAIGRVFISEVKGLFWNIPNDIYNKRARMLYHQYGEDYLRGGEFAIECKTIPLGNFANVDNKIGIVCPKPMMMIRNDHRQVEIKGRKNSGTLYVEEICADYVPTQRWHNDGDELIDIGFAMMLGDARTTERLSNSLFVPKIDGIKAIGICAADKKRYVLCANFTDIEKSFDVEALGARIAKSISEGKEETSFLLEPGKAVLLQF